MSLAWLYQARLVLRNPPRCPRLRHAHPKTLPRAACRHRDGTQRPIPDNIGVKDPIATRKIGGLLDGVALAVDGWEGEDEIRACLLEGDGRRANDGLRHTGGYIGARRAEATSGIQGVFRHRQG